MPKKEFESLKELFDSKRKSKKNSTELDWDERLQKWKKAIDILYVEVDNLLVSNLKKAGFKVSTSKEEVTLTEDYVGSYKVDNYRIQADSIRIIFNPIGTLIVGSYGRVNMVLPKETVILVLDGWKNWKIISKENRRTSLDFNESNLISLLQKYL